MTLAFVLASIAALSFFVLWVIERASRGIVEATKVKASNPSLGEDIEHYWIQVAIDDDVKVLRLTTGTIEEAEKTARRNSEDNPFEYN